MMKTPSFRQGPMSQLTRESEVKFLVTEFEFEGRLDISLEGNCYEVKVTLNLELVVTFVMSLEGDCHELYTKFHYKLIPYLVETKNSLKSSLLISYEQFTSLE
jgi:hypothetical protein